MAERPKTHLDPFCYGLIRIRAGPIGRLTAPNGPLQASRKGVRRHRLPKGPDEPMNRFVTAGAAVAATAAALVMGSAAASAKGSSATLSATPGVVVYTDSNPSQTFTRSAHHPGALTTI